MWMDLCRVLQLDCFVIDMTLDEKGTFLFLYNIDDIFQGLNLIFNSAGRCVFDMFKCNGV